LSGFHPGGLDAFIRLRGLFFMRWIIANDLPERVKLAWFGLLGVTVRSSDPELLRDLEARAAELRAQHAGPAEAAEAFAPARRLYHSLGIDPSKHRPASEALVRRILQGKEFPLVNTAVDAANLASITHLRPVGLYDLDLVRPETVTGDPPTPQTAKLVLRLGREGEGYPGIGKDFVNVHHRPTLVDSTGPFGNPSSDSDRTKVTLATRHLLFVLFEPVDESQAAIDAHLKLSEAIMLRHLGGETEP
jgi:DNA/RNA-binding domain of Phe-tRNA-synthetase-like protein